MIRRICFIAEEKSYREVCESYWINSFTFADPHCKPKGCQMSLCSSESMVSAACNFEQLVSQPDPDALWVNLGQRLQFQRWPPIILWPVFTVSHSGMSVDDDGIKVYPWQKLGHSSDCFSSFNRYQNSSLFWWLTHFKTLLGGKIFYKMLHLVLLLSASSLAKASYGPDIGPRYGYSSGYQQQHT